MYHLKCWRGGGRCFKCKTIRHALNRYVTFSDSGDPVRDLHSRRGPVETEIASVFFWCYCKTWNFHVEEMFLSLSRPKTCKFIIPSTRPTLPWVKNPPKFPPTKFKIEKPQNVTVTNISRFTVSWLFFVATRLRIDFMSVSCFRPLATCWVMGSGFLKGKIYCSSLQYKVVHVSKC